jgi:hypothetical protein
MKLFSSVAISLVALVACVGASGCAADTASSEDGAGSSTTEALGSGINVPNPSGAYFANVSANGTGCPAGTWDASISPDGQAFTITFSQYETQVSPGQALQVKDCTLAIDLHSPNGLSFAVSDFYYQGYSYLDSPGMTARQSAKYYFMGNPVPAREQRTDLAGPYDDSYLFQDSILTGDWVWSPCGTQRRLNALTRLVLTNNAQKSGSGYLNNSSVDAQTRTLFRFGLSWRSC